MSIAVPRQGQLPSISLLDLIVCTYSNRTILFQLTLYRHGALEDRIKEVENSKTSWIARAE